MTQAILGDMLGLTRTAVTAWESGKAFPEFRQLYRLAEALNVPLKDLLDGYEERPGPTQEEQIATKVAELLQDSLGLNSAGLVRESAGHVVTEGNGMPVDERALDRLAEEIANRLGNDFRALNTLIQQLIAKLPDPEKPRPKRKHR